MSSKTKDIGTIGEYKIITKFLENGISVAIPAGDNTAYDMLIDINGNFLKLQAKTTEYIHNNEYMIFPTNVTNPFKKTNRKYTREEVDVFGLYCLENGYMGLLCYDDYTSKDTIIRLTEPKNKQAKKIKMADEYLFEKQLDVLKQRYNRTSSSVG